MLLNPIRPNILKKGQYSKGLRIVCVCVCIDMQYKSYVFDVFIDHNRELMYNDRCQCLDVGLFVQARECCMESLRLGG